MRLEAAFRDVVAPAQKICRQSDLSKCKRRGVHNRRPNHVRARNGHVQLTDAERRRLCKNSGPTKKPHTCLVKENRAYNKSRLSYRGCVFRDRQEQSQENTKWLGDGRRGLRSGTSNKASECGWWYLEGWQGVLRYCRLPVPRIGRSTAAAQGQMQTEEEIV